jgi:hypothetical protein
MNRFPVLLPAALLLLFAQPGWAHIRVSYSLGRIISDSSNVLLMNVDKVDREKNLIVYRKVRDIKGTHPGEVIKHDIGQRGYSAIEWQNVMQSVQVGKPAVMFHNGGIGEICTERYWYQARAGEWWTMVHDEPMFLLAFTGRPDQLANAVTAMLAGQEATLPCMAPVQGDWTPLRSRRGKMLRMKASMKLQDYNFNRDFVGWGEQEYKPIEDMPGFTHVCSLGRMGSGLPGIEAGDLNADGMPDLCLYTPARVQVLKNEGGIFSDLSLPIKGGARGAAWADYDGDGRCDLFVAGTDGPRLFLNNTQTLADASARLPRSEYPNLTAAAQADFDADGRPDLLLADGFRGLRLYRNRGGQTNAPAAGGPPPLFEDVSDAVGLGAHGPGGNTRGYGLAVADVDGDRRPDVLFSAGTGLLILNTPAGFVPMRDSGIAFVAGGGPPSFGDANGDGKPDLVVPQLDRSPRLFVNLGGGRFRDATEQSPALRGGTTRAAAAAWCSLRGNGSRDLFVGCLRGPNRYLCNDGKGAFAEDGEQLGLDRRIFNTRSIRTMDVNGDGAMDVVLANEGQDWIVLLGAKAGGERASR